MLALVIISSIILNTYFVHSSYSAASKLNGREFCPQSTEYDFFKITTDSVITPDDLNAGILFETDNSNDFFEFDDCWASMDGKIIKCEIREENGSRAFLERFLGQEVDMSFPFLEIKRSVTKGVTYSETAVTSSAQHDQEEITDESLSRSSGANSTINGAEEIAVGNAAAAPTIINATSTIIKTIEVHVGNLYIGSVAGCSNFNSYLKNDSSCPDCGVVSM